MGTKEQSMIAVVEDLMRVADQNLKVAADDLARFDRIDSIDALICADRAIKAAIRKLRASVNRSMGLAGIPATLKQQAGR